MSETIKSDSLTDSEKPVKAPENGQFPPFPEPSDDDFEEDVPEEDRIYYKTKFLDLNNITNMKVHCTSCDRHLGLVPKNESRIKMHPLLRTLVCHTCHSFYNSGEFEKGDDGSELYCRWCGQGGQVYCCSGCPHVFCAKCIKRNLGPTKIKEIEELDDWKCFKCNSKCLKDLRAICWAALRFCNLKNRLAQEVQDTAQKELCIQDCAKDHSECCKAKNRKKEKTEARKKESDNKKNTTSSIISKISPTIQVKKFASISVYEAKKAAEPKKAIKRSASPKNKPFILKNPITVATKGSNTFNVSPMTKKMRVPPAPVVNPIRIMNDRKQAQPVNNFIKIKPKPGFNAMLNGMPSGTFNTIINNDNINLSLENLTQGLDMASMSNIAGGSQDDELVCTPDFPMEPLCEVTEDNTDDDVQCITPGPSTTPKCPPLVSLGSNSNEISPESIVQMTEQDVTVNSTTGGLKFRVDPQTLSSKKMYRLPDGRIFAINANPNMPGGYSATIVAVTESNTSKSTGATYAAKINHVTSRQRVSTPTPTPRILAHSRNMSTPKNINRQHKITKEIPSRDTPTRETDLQVPVEWYRYNLIDAIDALEYSLSRLHKLKREATTSYLRTRTVPEMRTLHRSLENLLNTSTQRFKEIRENINKELKQYILRKTSNTHNSDDDDDDDDVEILPNVEDDPIFIDENSLDSCANETQEVDLTGPGSSEQNDSDERILRGILNVSKKTDGNILVPGKFKKNNDKSIESVQDADPHKETNVNCEEQIEMSQSTSLTCTESIAREESAGEEENKEDSSKTETVHGNFKSKDRGSKSTKSNKDLHNVDKRNTTNIIDKLRNKDVPQRSNKEIKASEKENGEHDDSESKGQDIDISDEMIDDLLKGDAEENTESNDICTLDISDEIKGD